VNANIKRKLVGRLQKKLEAEAEAKAEELDNNLGVMS